MEIDCHYCWGKWDSAHPLSRCKICRQRIPILLEVIAPVLVFISVKGTKHTDNVKIPDPYRYRKTCFGHSASLSEGRGPAPGLPRKSSRNGLFPAILLKRKSDFPSRSVCRKSQETVPFQVMPILASAFFHVFPFASFSVCPNISMDFRQAFRADTTVFSGACFFKFFSKDFEAFSLISVHHLKYIAQGKKIMANITRFSWTALKTV